MSTTDPYLAAIEGTFPDLDGWQSRGATAEEPQRDSDLFVDDLIFLSMPMSQMARLSLLSASEHLRVVRDTLTARNLYPTAVHTVLRSALVGASQAVWMLDPDDRTTRQERAVILVEEMIRQSRVVLVEPGKTAPSPSDAAAIQDQLRYLDERLALLRNLRTSAAQLNQTTMIGWALEHTFSDPGLQDAGRIWWRRMSSDAHVLGWSLFQRSVVSQVDRRSGIATLTAPEVSTTLPTPTWPASECSSTAGPSSIDAARRTPKGSGPPRYPTRSSTHAARRTTTDHAADRNPDPRQRPDEDGMPKFGAA